LVSISKLEFKRVIRVSFIFSALINIGHGWQYQAVEDLQLKNNDASYTQTYIINDNSFSDYPFANQDQAYLLYSIVYFIIN
jgi:hypothetical protein